MFCWSDAGRFQVEALLARYDLQLCEVAAGERIPGSYWGDREAGLVGARLYVRSDTPLHSLLHEACHYICMTPARRAVLDTDAGGDFAEEDAVCYLQILLAEALLPGQGGEALCRDMDAWGYTFRLGSAHRWFTDDAQDARQWLQREGLIHEDARPGFRLRS